jgi:hypothetical protein
MYSNCVHTNTKSFESTYNFSIHTAISAIECLLLRPPQNIIGFATPAQAFGPEFAWTRKNKQNNEVEIPGVLFEGLLFLRRFLI